MQYKTSKYGNIIKEDNGVITLIPMDETSTFLVESVISAYAFIGLVFAPYGKIVSFFRRLPFSGVAFL